MFYSNAAPRYLHSFPTRRSSDLPWRTSFPAGPGSRLRHDRRSVARKRNNESDSWRAARSEEHTSELQSLTNLVCRLLLEKKKKIKEIMNLRQEIHVITV